MMYPDRRSKSTTPKRCRGTPNQLSEKGVSKTTTSSGTINMRSSVKEFGRFTKLYRLEANPATGISLSQSSHLNILRRSLEVAFE